jgi:hypothetical protein
MQRRTWLTVGAVLLLAGGTAVTACAADTTDATETGEITCFAVSDLPPDATRVDVTLKEWAIELSSTTIKAGNVGFVATNGGTMIHEMLVVRIDDPANLPYAPNGSVNEDAIPTADVLGEIAEFAAGTTCAHGFSLTPGHYVLFCNIAEGDVVHLERGMLTPFTVTA